MTRRWQGDKVTVKGKNKTQGDNVTMWSTEATTTYNINLRRLHTNNDTNYKSRETDKVTSGKNHKVTRWQGDNVANAFSNEI